MVVVGLVLGRGCPVLNVDFILINGTPDTIEGRVTDGTVFSFVEIDSTGLILESNCLPGLDDAVLTNDGTVVT